MKKSYKNREKRLSSSLTEFSRPVFEFFQTLFADTRSNVDQTLLKVFYSNGSNLVG